MARRGAGLRRRRAVCRAVLRRRRGAGLRRVRRRRRGAARRAVLRRRRGAGLRRRVVLRRVALRLRVRAAFLAAARRAAALRLRVAAAFFAPRLAAADPLRGGLRRVERRRRFAVLRRLRAGFFRAMDFPFVAGFFFLPDVARRLGAAFLFARLGAEVFLRRVAAEVFLRLGFRLGLPRRAGFT